MDYKDKTILITGGSSGIGLALARSFVHRGAVVWLLARRKEILERALQSLSSIQASGSRPCGLVSADVADSDQVEAAVAEVVDSAGLPEIVINSAGITQPGYFLDLTPDEFDKLIAVNYCGTVNVIRAILPGMMARCSGYLVAIGSMSSYIGSPGYTAYSASKFALRGFCDSLRSELKPIGIDISIVYPPDTDTPQLEYDNQFKPPEIKELNSSAGLMEPNKLAELILRGISRKQYLILPNFEAKLSYLISPIIYPLVDFLYARARRKFGLQTGCE